MLTPSGCVRVQKKGPTATLFQRQLGMVWRRIHPLGSRRFSGRSRCVGGSFPQMGHQIISLNAANREHNRRPSVHKILRRRLREQDDAERGVSDFGAEVALYYIV